ncbi:O-methyltransferase [Thalassobacillus hwangdonensis]|uniref:tRNA 5-hydroxyuridine methyltransferase n=1 Tax=Thalassobacillus hwangdonensis TaxID=546108 RepID=A0ABW3KZ74_9BACI
MEQNEYLASLLPSGAPWVEDMERYAEQHHIPIMEPTGIHFLMQLIRIKRPDKILEVGAAIGYSALRMKEAYPETEIVTIERDQDRYETAKRYLDSLDKEGQINLVYGDALEVKEQIAAQAPYDLIFIDAAKGKYQTFFEMFAPMLADKGMIVSDNVLFKGYVHGREDDNKKMHKIGRKIDAYNQWLMQQDDFETNIVPIGDGVAISVKK